MDQKPLQQPQEKLQEQPRQEPLRQKPRGWTGLGEKTLWDWLQLLIVPVALAVAGFLFAATQESNQQQAEERRAQSQQESEERRAQDEALRAYLNEMGSLLLEEDLRDSQFGDEVRQLADARTSAVLDQAGPSQKRSIVKFLYTADLIIEAESWPPVSTIDLRDANLSSANLSRLALGKGGVNSPPRRGVYLVGANLSGADLSDAELGDALLTNADLSYADLSRAYLADARLRRTGAPMGSAEADLTGADLSNADLSGADVTEEQLEAARSLEGATMPDGSTHD